MLKITNQDNMIYSFFEDLDIGELFKWKDSFYIKCCVNSISHSAYSVKNHIITTIAPDEKVIPYEGELIIKHPLL